MREELLERWATVETEREPLEEGLIRSLLESYNTHCESVNIKKVKSVFLDVCSGFSTPMFVLDLATEFSYHGIEPNRKLAKVCRELCLDGAIVESRSVEDVLQAVVKEPVAIVLGYGDPSDLVTSPASKQALFSHLAAYRSGKWNDHQMLMAEWLRDVARKEKAVITGLVVPVDSCTEFINTGPNDYDDVVVGDSHAIFIWKCTKALPLTTQHVANMGWSAWEWRGAKSLIVGKNVVRRKGDRLDPCFSDTDSALRSACHILTNTPEVDGWSEKIAYKLGILEARNIMRRESVQDVLDSCVVALGQPFELENPTFVKKLINQYNFLRSNYPDNGDQECRYWLLQQGHKLEGPDGTYEVMTYQPSTLQGQPPVITVKKV